jgi:hypothetical protein
MYGLVSFECPPVGTLPPRTVSQNGTPHRLTVMSPLSNSFRINHLSGFAFGPPHVSPLESSICRKQWGMGGGLMLATSHSPLDIVPTSPLCFLSLTRIPMKTPKKSPNVFYHLQTASPLSTCVFYHFQKRRGEGVQSLVGLAFRRACPPKPWRRSGHASHQPLATSH